MTLKAILAELKRPPARASRDKDVQDVLPSAKLLRHGSERTAYTVGRWVVKKQNGRAAPPTKVLRSLGVHPPTQWLVNGWQVQPCYRRLSQVSLKMDLAWAEAGLDLGSHNVGLDRWGRYVAFDW